ncbi:MAG: ABC-type cytochrome c biosis transport system permease component [Bacteroidetes bacterium]|jgi:heme exporter protein C|nr:ABC-type cytochrome c biosis transport system permease component [Bacteroidota bacterium]
MLLRGTLGVLLTLVIVAAFVPPIVSQPQSWYEFPLIPGLEEKARIIFFHVPTAWLSVMAFVTSMFYGIRYLRKRDMMDDLRSSSAAGLGLLFCILATVTGAIWAKFNWGSFWNWDPRETSIFVLLLIYGAYFSLRSAVEVEEKRATLSSVYSIIAAVTVPFFIFIMPRIMTGLHPGAKGDPDGAGPVIDFKMSLNMRVVFFASLIAFTLLFIWMFNLRVRAARLEYRHQLKG